MITNNPLYFLCGAIFGGMLGATATLMLTPESGADIRDQLRGLILNGKPMKKKRSMPHAMKVTSKRTAKPKAKKAAPKRTKAAHSNTEK